MGYLRNKLLIKKAYEISPVRIFITHKAMSQLLHMHLFTLAEVYNYNYMVVFDISSYKQISEPGIKRNIMSREVESGKR